MSNNGKILDKRYLIEQVRNAYSNVADSDLLMNRVEAGDSRVVPILARLRDQIISIIGTSVSKLFITQSELGEFCGRVKGVLDESALEIREKNTIDLELAEKIFTRILEERIRVRDEITKNFQFYEPLPPLVEGADFAEYIVQVFSQFIILQKSSYYDFTSKLGAVRRVKNNELNVPNKQAYERIVSVKELRSFFNRIFAKLLKSEIEKSGRSGKRFDFIKFKEILLAKLKIFISGLSTLHKKRGQFLTDAQNIFRVLKNAVGQMTEAEFIALETISDGSVVDDPTYIQLVSRNILLDAGFDLGCNKVSLGEVTGALKGDELADQIQFTDLNRPSRSATSQSHVASNVTIPAPGHELAPAPAPALELAPEPTPAPEAEPALEPAPEPAPAPEAEPALEPAPESALVPAPAPAPVVESPAPVTPAPVATDIEPTPAPVLSVAPVSTPLISEANKLSEELEKRIVSALAWVDGLPELLRYSYVRSDIEALAFVLKRRNEIDAGNFSNLVRFALFRLEDVIAQCQFQAGGALLTNMGKDDHISTVAKTFEQLNLFADSNPAFAAVTDKAAQLLAPTLVLRKELSDLEEKQLKERAEIDSKKVANLAAQIDLRNKRRQLDNIIAELTRTINKSHIPKNDDYSALIKISDEIKTQSIRCQEILAELKKLEVELSKLDVESGISDGDKILLERIRARLTESENKKAAFELALEKLVTRYS